MFPYSDDLYWVVLVPNDTRSYFEIRIAYGDSSSGVNPSKINFRMIFIIAIIIFAIIAFCGVVSCIGALVIRHFELRKRGKLTGKVVLQEHETSPEKTQHNEEEEKAANAEDVLDHLDIVP